MCKTQANVALRFYFKLKTITWLQEVVILFDLIDWQSIRRIARGRLIYHMWRKKGGESGESPGFLPMSIVSKLTVIYAVNTFIPIHSRLIHVSLGSFEFMK